MLASAFFMRGKLETYNPIYIGWYDEGWRPPLGKEKYKLV
jgi:hypothetical protein